MVQLSYVQFSDNLSNGIKMSEKILVFKTTNWISNCRNLYKLPSELCGLGEVVMYNQKIRISEKTHN